MPPVAANATGTAGVPLSGAQVAAAPAPFARGGAPVNARSLGPAAFEGNGALANLLLTAKYLAGVPFVDGGKKWVNIADDDGNQLLLGSDLPYVDSNFSTSSDIIKAADAFPFDDESPVLTRNMGTQTDAIAEWHDIGLKQMASLGLVAPEPVNAAQIWGREHVAEGGYDIAGEYWDLQYDNRNPLFVKDGKLTVRRTDGRPNPLPQPTRVADVRLAPQLFSFVPTNVQRRKFWSSGTYTPADSARLKSPYVDDVMCTLPSLTDDAKAYFPNGIRCKLVVNTWTRCCVIKDVTNPPHVDDLALVGKVVLGVISAIIAIASIALGNYLAGGIALVGAGAAIVSAWYDFQGNIAAGQHAITSNIGEINRRFGVSSAGVGDIIKHGFSKPDASRSRLFLLLAVVAVVAAFLVLRR